MTLWIDSNNMLHDDMDGAALTLASWPQGLTEATADQIAAIQNPPAPPAPPLTATPYQFKAALVQANLYTQALAAVNAGPLLTQLAWADALVFTENDPLIVSMATALGQTTGQVHALFQLAGTLSL